MTVTAKQIVASKYIENSQTTQFTVGAGTRLIVDKFTVTNQTGSAETFSVNIVPSGGSAGNDNRIVNTFSVAAGVTELTPGMVGQILEAGAFISMIASATSALSVSISGREVTV